MCSHQRQQQPTIRRSSKSSGKSPACQWSWRQGTETTRCSSAASGQNRATRRRTTRTAKEQETQQQLREPVKPKLPPGLLKHQQTAWRHPVNDTRPVNVLIPEQTSSRTGQGCTCPTAQAGRRRCDGGRVVLCPCSEWHVSDNRTISGFISCRGTKQLTKPPKTKYSNYFV